jgi:hypothetical protein
MKAWLVRLFARMYHLTDCLKIDEICEKSPEIRVQMIIRMMRAREQFNSNFHP